MLRKKGVTVKEATKQLEGRSVVYKIQHAINFDGLPSWQKRGTGVWFKDYEKAGFNPITQKEVRAVRRGLYVEYELPLGRESAALISDFLSSTLLQRNSIL